MAPTYMFFIPHLLVLKTNRGCTCRSIPLPLTQQIFSTTVWACFCWFQDALALAYTSVGIISLDIPTMLWYRLWKWDIPVKIGIKSIILPDSSDATLPCWVKLYDSSKGRFCLRNIRTTVMFYSQSFTNSPKCKSESLSRPVMPKYILAIFKWVTRYVSPPAYSFGRQKCTMCEGLPSPFPRSNDSVTKDLPLAHFRFGSARYFTSLSPPSTAIFLARLPRAKTLSVGNCFSPIELMMISH